MIQKDFLNTRSRQSTFLQANQNADLITHEPMKFRVRKVKIKVQTCGNASKRAPGKWKQYQVWILLNAWDIQTIYDSVKKELQDECHCVWSLLKVTWTSRFGSLWRWLRSWIAHQFFESLIILPSFKPALSRGFCCFKSIVILWGFNHKQKSFCKATTKISDEFYHRELQPY